MLCPTEAVNLDGWSEDFGDRSVSLARKSHLAKARNQLLTLSVSHPKRGAIVKQFHRMRSRAALYEWIDEPDEGIRVERTGDDFILEWNHRGCVLGFTFGAEDRDTGYFFTAPGPRGGLPTSESGSLEELTADALVRLLRVVEAMT